MDAWNALPPQATDTVVRVLRTQRCRSVRGDQMYCVLSVGDTCVGDMYAGDTCLGETDISDGAKDSRAFTALGRLGPSDQNNYIIRGW